MLCITRRKGESIVITASNGEHIEVHLIAGHGRMRLGIDAPIEVHVRRSELPESKSWPARGSRAGEGSPGLSSRDAQTAGQAEDGATAALDHRFDPSNHQQGGDAMPIKPCPKCRRIKSVVPQGELFYCQACAAFFDDDPDEGGDYSDRNPSARIERQERQKGRRRAS